VFDILGMWDQIESGVEAAKATERTRIASELHLSPQDLKFWGFDGNNERQFGIATFVVKVLGRYDRYSSRDLNSHRRVVDLYRRMLTEYRSIERSIEGKELSPDQIIRILAARHLPGSRKARPEA
jgi:uncharacterized protein YfbU (UPF0304 family)